jgi:hypothetical protein
MQPTQGTPIFMARAVRQGQREQGEHEFFPMPELQDGYSRYKIYLERRFEEFPMNAKETVNLQADEDIQPFSHQLRYDAESVFWLLLWWAIQAKPEGDTLDKDRIKNTHWNLLTNTGEEEVEDPRSYYILKFPKMICHAEYRELEILLRSMSIHLRGDHGLVSSRSHPEYLHEVFQRLIFEFLSKHGKAKSKFLTLKKSEDLRKLQNQEQVVQPLPTSKRTWETSQATASHVASSQKRKHGGGDDDDYTETSQCNKKASQISAKLYRYSHKIGQEVISSADLGIILVSPTSPVSRIAGILHIYNSFFEYYSSFISVIVCRITGNLHNTSGRAVRIKVSRYFREQ